MNNTPVFSLLITAQSAHSNDIQMITKDFPNEQAAEVAFEQILGQSRHANHVKYLVTRLYRTEKLQREYEARQANRSQQTAE